MKLYSVIIYLEILDLEIEIFSINEDYNHILKAQIFKQVSASLTTGN
jgi:hypothetical protein